jgi:hypothetical protein
VYERAAISAPQRTGMRGACVHVCSLTQTATTIRRRALLDFTHSEQEPALQRTHLQILNE